MLPKRNLFRQEALDNLSATEPLDRALQITAPREQLAVMACLAVLITLVAWSFLAVIPYNVTAEGLLTSNQSQVGKTNVILSPAEGHLLQILVTVGDHVQAGQAVATLTLANAGDLIEVTSLYSGKVVKLIMQPDSPISTNQSILSLTGDDNTSGTLEAIVYVSLPDAQKITPGQKVLIAPETVPQQEFGFLVGSVIALGQFPSVDSFARGLSPVDPVIEVRVQLQPDPTNASGYQWTLGRGPASSLRPRTLCRAIVTIREERPISRVLRFLNPYDFS